MVTYDSAPEELEQIKKISKDLAAKMSEDRWKTEQFMLLGKLRRYLEDKPLMDMLLYDISQKESLDYLWQIREKYQMAQILLLADIKTSPMEYMRPGIRANALLLRPWTKRQVKEVLQEFIGEYLKMVTREKQDGSMAFVIELKDGRLSIPYDRIYFFEAREKKIFICTGKEEFGFYHTIDKLVEKLPKNFVRCHRGFIVNTDKIRKIMLSKNIIYLEDGFDVPLSRSYKSVLKGFGKNDAADL